MDTYKIEQECPGWFRVIVTASNGDNHIRDGFVSETAARKWADRDMKRNAKSDRATPR